MAGQLVNGLVTRSLGLNRRSLVPDGWFMGPSGQSLGSVSGGQMVSLRPDSRSLRLDSWSVGQNGWFWGPHSQSLKLWCRIISLWGQAVSLLTRQSVSGAGWSVFEAGWFISVTGQFFNGLVTWSLGLNRWSLVPDGWFLGPSSQSLESDSQPLGPDRTEQSVTEAGPSLSGAGQVKYCRYLTGCKVLYHNKFVTRLPQCPQQRLLCRTITTGLTFYGN